MGLDKRFKSCLDYYVTLKLLLARLGRQKRERVSPVTAERQRFEKEVKQELLKLKKIGVNIPVFTL